MRLTARNLVLAVGWLLFSSSGPTVFASHPMRMLDRDGAEVSTASGGALRDLRLVGDAVIDSPALQLARSMMHAGQLGGAVLVCRAMMARSRCPDRAAAMHLLVALQQAAEAPIEDAITGFSEALQCSNHYAPAHVDLGVLRFNQVPQHLEQASRHFELALDAAAVGGTAVVRVLALFMSARVQAARQQHIEVQSVAASGCDCKCRRSHYWSKCSASHLPEVSCGRWRSTSWVLLPQCVLLCDTWIRQARRSWL